MLRWLFTLFHRRQDHVPRLEVLRDVDTGKRVLADSYGRCGARLIPDRKVLAAPRRCVCPPPPNIVITITRSLWREANGPHHQPVCIRYMPDIYHGP